MRLELPALFGQFAGRALPLAGELRAEAAGMPQAAADLRGAVALLPVDIVQRTLLLLQAVQCGMTTSA